MDRKVSRRYFPASTEGQLGQMKQLRSVVCVEEKEEVGVPDGIALLVQLSEGIAVQQDAEATREMRVPRLVVHLFARGLQPGDVLHAGTAYGPTLQERPAPQGGVELAQADDLAGEGEEVLPCLVEVPGQPGSLGCPGSRRCCCPSACGPSRLRPGSSALPARGAACAIKFRFCCSRERWIAGSSVGPSTPQFQLSLSSVPSRFSSPLASLCLLL